MPRTYFVYILTNSNKTVLYTGMTNNLGARLIEHYLNKGRKQTFAGRYFCYNLVYYEMHSKPMDAIEREKEIKDWNREKKEALIRQMNPDWTFLNSEIMEWPPAKGVKGRY